MITSINIKHQDFLANFPSSTITYLDDSKKNKKEDEVLKAIQSKHFDLNYAIQLQALGYGVYFSVNGFKGYSRKEIDLETLNGLMIDLDICKEEDNLQNQEKTHRKKAEVNKLINYSLPPHIIVETKNGLQVIWLLREGYDHKSINCAKDIQLKLIHIFQADLGAQGTTRLIRMPGFKHLKNINDPFLCELVHYHIERPRYNIDEFDNVLPKTIEKKKLLGIYDRYSNLHIKDVLLRLSEESNIKIDLSTNSDGSEQIIENGEITSGFISSRGEFVYSSSGKPRKGDVIHIVAYYLKLSKSDARKWINHHFPHFLDSSVKQLEVNKDNFSVFKDYKDFNPSLYFDDKKAYITVRVKEKIIDKGPIQENSYIITSDKERIVYNSDNIAELGFYCNKEPSVRSRWSGRSISDFLSKDLINNVQNNTLIDDISKELSKYSDLQDKQLYVIIPIWILGTYYHQLFNTYPYLSITGNKGCGKSNLLIFISQLSFNGIFLTSKTTPAYIIRMIHDNSATCCIDEVEQLTKARDSDTRSILAMYNSGYKKGAKEGKCDINAKKITTKEYDSYSPKVFAGIQGLEDTLASRCIPITMIKSSNTFISNSNLDTTNPVWQLLRDRSYLHMLHNWNSLRILYPFIEEERLVGRDAELWKPILTLTKLFVPLQYDLVKDYAIETSHNREEFYSFDQTSSQILHALDEYFQENNSPKEILSVEQIFEILLRYDEEHFLWLINRKKGMWIGDQLRKAGVIREPSKTTRINGKPVKTYTIYAETIKERLKAYT